MNLVLTQDIVDEESLVVFPLRYGAVRDVMGSSCGVRGKEEVEREWS